MESALLVAVIVGLFWFRGPIKSVANLIEKVIKTSADVSEDSLGVYMLDIRTNNAKQRGLIQKKIDKYTADGTFATQDEIETLLNKALEDKSTQD